MIDIRPVALPGTQQQFYPQTHVNAVIGLTSQFLYAQVKTLLDWKDIANKPDLVTQNDLKTAIDGIQGPTITWASIPDKPDLATKADVATAVSAIKVPDVSGLAKQTDLALTQKYGLPINYWINKTQTVGKSLDSSGLPTVVNTKAITSDLMPYDSTAQLVCVGWGAEINDQLTVAYYDSHKKFLSSTIWTITAKGTGDRPRSIIEFYKYAVASTAYIRISCGYSDSPQCMVVSAVFEQHDFVPALADLQVDDSGWQSIALINGAKPQADTINRIRKIGNVVYPELAANTLPSQGAIAQLPVGYRPTQRIWRITRSNAGSQFIEYSIDVDGSVFVGGKPGRTLSSGDYVWISEPFVGGN